MAFLSDATYRQSADRKVLPTNRMTFEKQLHLLRGYAAGYAHYKEPVSIRQVANVAKMNRDTISMANAFLLDAGLIDKSGLAFVPSAATIAFNHAHEWNAETAPQKLGSALQKTWFAQKLMPLVMMGAVTEEAAIRELASESSAGPENRSQLKMLLDFLERSGVLKREGDSYVKGTTFKKGDGEIKDIETGVTGTSLAPEPKEPPAPRSSTTTTFQQMAAGGVQFSINLKVDMAEFGGWEGDRIQAFFAGIAQVLAAKAKIEQDLDV